ncbi:MAG: iron ABC transporter permease [Methanofollis sp.]|uniref:FecCD family ABC transporter permease n=1 Tax=Methanofollis sp. TaxID=2052835 RepID=UPI0026260B4D|nr:iron ABC transporter permease [Methanofollis sp.]MDD4254853.1 iron ABC transporter permease [Methanofollis sp.]
MHLTSDFAPKEYNQYIGRKYAVILGGLLILFILVIISISVGAVAIPPLDVVRTLTGTTISDKYNTIIWNIRLPQVLAAVCAGIGLSVAGAAMQSILRNPLGSPFTLGISSAGAFGAAFSIIVLGAGTVSSTGTDIVTVTNPWMTTATAFAFCLLATGVILLLSTMREASPESMILAGVALGSLFSAGTMLLQYFADDTKLASVVFWSFGDVGRATWGSLTLIAVIVAASVIYFILNRWNYNAIDAGDETAKALGVEVERVRLTGMVAASLVTAVTVSFLGVIGFVGLICPHMMRRLIGNDERFLIPASCVAGAVLLLASDTAARLIISPRVLPVAILTTFLGVPIFLWMVFRRTGR